MSRDIKKYFITLLSALLILSNFSFASSLMICQMSQNVRVCECIHEKNTEDDCMSIKKIKANCCSSESVELANSNLLTILKTELPKKIFLYGPLTIDLNRDFTSQSNSNYIHEVNKTHLPKRDIPISLSSLLI